MTVLEALLVGTLAGLTEFLPVSLSAHLAVLRNIFHLSGADLSDPFLRLAIQLGAAAAVLFAFRRDRRLLGAAALRKSSGKSKERRFLRLLGIGTVPLLIPIFLRSLLFSLSTHTVLIALFLILTGVLLYAAEYKAYARNSRAPFTAAEAAAVGAGQAIAYLPGLSRSGVSVACGLLCGLDTDTSLRYSCWLAVLGGILWLPFNLYDIIVESTFSFSYLIVAVLSGLIGYIVLRILRTGLSRTGLYGYAYYCWGAGLLIFILSLIS